MNSEMEDTLCLRLLECSFIQRAWLVCSEYSSPISLKGNRLMFPLQWKKIEVRGIFLAVGSIFKAIHVFSMRRGLLLIVNY